MSRNVTIDEETGEMIMAEAPVGNLAVIQGAEIDQQIATAKKYPRSLSKFVEQTKGLVTMSEEIAESCIYALKRGNKIIKGPSARFAEIIASQWGNARFGSRTVAESRKRITAQGVFHDLERNIAITIEVERNITDKEGRTFKEDMIAVTGNAAGSIAMRNAVLKGIPKVFWQPIYEEAERVLLGNVKTLSSRREAALNHLGVMGVTPERVFSALGINGEEEISLGLLATLRQMIVAIKDESTTVEEQFPEIPKAGAKTLNEKLDKVQAQGDSHATESGNKAAEGNEPEPTESATTEQPEDAKPARAARTRTID